MKTKGFTLVELLVVIAILAILATVSVVGYTSFIENANNSAAQQELVQIRDKVIADDILNNNVVVDGSEIVLNLAAKDATAAATEATKYFTDLAAGLDGTVTITATYAEVKTGETVTGYTATVTEVKYEKDSGSATWTVGGNVQ